MSPNEKARELVGNMLQFQVLPEKGFVNEETLLQQAKECAILCCKEIITTNPRDNSGRITIASYWESTIEEITKLT